MSFSYKIDQLNLYLSSLSNFNGVAHFVSIPITIIQLTISLLFIFSFLDLPFSDGQCRLKERSLSSFDSSLMSSVSLTRPSTLRSLAPGGDISSSAVASAHSPTLAGNQGTHLSQKSYSIFHSNSCVFFHLDFASCSSSISCSI